MSDALTGLPLLRLHFIFEPLGRLALAGYTGSTWHGALGHALARVSPDAFELLFGALPDEGRAPRPFVLRPQAHDAAAGADARLGLTLVLIGPAVALAAQVLLAMEHLAATGLGTHRTPLRLVAVTHEAADGRCSPVLATDGTLAAGGLTPTSAVEVMAAWDGLPVRRVLLRFDTRLRLKAANRLVEAPPPCGLLLQRLLERVSALAALYGSGPLPTPMVRALLAAAETVEMASHALRWAEWTRTSGRTGQVMPWGGLVGEIEYQGEVAPLLPWLGLGGWLHVGSKTSFGLGHYTLYVAPV